MTKVVKVYLISKQTDKEDNPIDYSKVNKILWELQRQTRDLKNKAVQLCWEWSGFSSDYKKKNDEYPKDKDILNYTLSGYVYDRLKSGSGLYTNNLSTSLRDVCAAFKNAQKEMLKGEKSILSYKSNQPLDLHNRAIVLSYSDNEFYIELKLLNRTEAEKYGFGNSIKFKMRVKDKSTRTILERCVDNIYKISASKLIYDTKKKMWCINLCYSFDNRANSNLDEDKILGVNLGIVHPIVASIYGDYDRFIIDGGEIEEFRRRVEARKNSILRQTKYCGDGRIGHGVIKRTEPAFKIKNKIARFRDTVNHKYSRALVNYAVRKGCGIIQMEDLTGISVDKGRFLKEWSYYDLQTKIEYKAKEAGIKVIYIAPQFTSQRCSKCGCICADNRPSQAVFKCQSCEFKTNADYNASQNISIKDIDKIIEQSIHTKECESQVNIK